jgi:hypothetical protein
MLGAAIPKILSNFPLKVLIILLQAHVTHQNPLEVNLASESLRYSSFAIQFVYADLSA